MAETISTPVTKLLGIRVPILLAGMSGVAHAELAAAVSNAGGMGIIGGLTFTPKMLKKEIKELKHLLASPDLPWGVDLALPKVGGGARKTNHDYTHGKLPELVDIIINEGAKLFVSAVGVPPRWLVEKMHAAGIPVMNMCGDPSHIAKAVAVGCDLMCAQGTEAGGHTGDVATFPLVPQCVDACKGKISELTGGPVHVIAAGGISDGRGVAAALSLGAGAVWVGTRFVASTESVASNRHKQAIVDSMPKNTVRTLIYSGRPLRTFTSEYVKDWEVNRSDEIKELCAQGQIPFQVDFRAKRNEEKPLSLSSVLPMLFGQACGGISEVKPAGEIVRDMMAEATAIIKANAKLIAKL